MSNLITSTTGYGFSVADVDEKKLKKFIVAHEATIRKRNRSDEIKMLECCLSDDNYDLDSLFEDFEDIEDDISFRKGAKSIISNIINTEAITVQYEPGDEEESMILFPFKAPWQYGAEIPTEESVNACFEPYLKELNIHGCYYDTVYYTHEFL